LIKNFNKPEELRPILMFRARIVNRVLRQGGWLLQQGGDHRDDVARHGPQLTHRDVCDKGDARSS